MTLGNEAAAESGLSSQKRFEAEQAIAVAGTPVPSPHSTLHIKVGQREALVAGKTIQVFTMTLGQEKIDLLPLKTWAQLDLYKWRVRGILPATPAGLEIGFDHTKLMGQTVLPQDPDACAKLESLFSQWLEMEREALEAAKRKAQLKATKPAGESEGRPEQAVMRFHVNVDKEGQVHVSCVKGKEVLATIGLNTPGFQSLVNQGWMRKPHSLKTGALHDWVEIDGVLFSFEKGQDCSSEFAKVLNDSYLPPATTAKSKEILVYANAASPTGFDIQFQAKVGGVLENRRRPLAEEALTLLQDPDHCGFVPHGLVIKLSRPYFIFKEKTPDGGERYLEEGPENLVRVVDEDGLEKLIDLSHPVNYLHLRAIDLTAIFNHPSINRHARAMSAEDAPPATRSGAPSPVRALSGAGSPSPAATLASAISSPPSSVGSVQGRNVPREPASPVPPVSIPAARPVVSPAAVQPPKPLPNLWAKPLLLQPPMRFDWFSCLVYEKVATWVGNSDQGTFLETECWHVQLGEESDMESPGFMGLFDTRNGSFGFLSGGFLLRFEDGVMYLGTAESALKAPGVHPIAVAMDSAGRLCFIVTEGYRVKFGVPDQDIAARLAELTARGGKLMSIRETLESHDPLEVIWTVPAHQADLNNPEAIEQVRPETPP